MRPELVPYLAIDEQTRLREEDPYADYWTLACGGRLLPQRSRFEVDLNRPRNEAVCAVPEDCWGLKVWNRPLPAAILEHSLHEHDAFYATLQDILETMRERYGRFVVFDLHSYNHRRGGPGAPAVEQSGNPELNIGTGSMDRRYWGALVDRFMRDLADFDFQGRGLDVRENVKFRGRYLAEFVHARFPESGCVLSIEVKKFFMDEWTGAADTRQVEALLDAFRATVPGLLDELSKR